MLKDDEAYHKIYYLKNKFKMNERAKIYQSKNKEKLRNYMREYMRRYRDAGYSKRYYTYARKSKKGIIKLEPKSNEGMKIIHKPTIITF